MKALKDSRRRLSERLLKALREGRLAQERRKIEGEATRWFRNGRKKAES